jgi:hypothetical protein
MQHTESNGEPTMACVPTALGAEGRVRHSEAAVSVVKGRRQERRIVAGGVEYLYPVDRELAAALASWAVEEKMCCPFLDMRLELPGGEPVMVLAIGGRPGASEMFETSLDAL